MAANPNMTALGDNEVLQQLANSSRRIRNRGLRDYLRQRITLFQGDEFRPEDVRHLVQEKYPAADAVALGNALADLARSGAGVERVGSRSGVYRIAGTAPNLEDEAIIENALKALADLEGLVQRYRELLPTIRSLKKALG